MEKKTEYKCPNCQRREYAIREVPSSVIESIEKGKIYIIKYQNYTDGTMSHTKELNKKAIKRCQDCDSEMRAIMFTWTKNQI